MVLNFFISDQEKYIEKDISLAAWILFGVTYLYSGIAKLQINEWRSGVAVEHVLKMGIARHHLLSNMIINDSAFGILISYSTIALEVCTIFLIFNRSGKILILLLSSAFHICNMIFLRMEELSLGMLVFHAFLYASIYSDKNSYALNPQSKEI